MKEEIVSLYKDYNCGSLVLAASVLPIGYADPLDLMTFCLVNTFPICNTFVELGGGVDDALARCLDGANVEFGF